MTAIVAVCAVLGHPYIQVAFQIVSALCVVSIGYGVYLNRPERRGLWYGLACGAITFFVSYAARLVWPAWWPESTWEPKVPDFLDAIAFALCIVGVQLAGRARDRYKDPTAVIDAWILTGGLSAVAWIAVILPYAHDERYSQSGRVLQVSASVITLWLIFACLRLALGAGVKTRAFRPLALAAGLGLCSQVSSSAFGGAENAACVAFGALALVALGLTALHPNMAAMTQTSSQGVRRVTTTRIVLMSCAVIAAPVTLAIQEVQGNADLSAVLGLALSWLVITSLVMARLFGLVRARERMADIEATLRQAAASLAAAADSEAIFDATLRAVEHMTDSLGLVSTVLMLREDDHWSVAAVGEARGLDPSVDVTNFTRRLNFKTGHILKDCVPIEGSSLHITVIPMRSQYRVRGALVAILEQPSSSSVEDALSALAVDCAMALDAINLAGDLHKQESDARFHALVRHSSDVTVVIGPNGLITYATPSTGHVLGADPQNLVGSPFADLLHLEDRPVFRQMVSLLVPGQVTPKQVEVRMRDGAGTFKTMDITITDLRHERSIKGIVVNAHDVSDRKTLEQDLRRKVFHDDLTGIANRVLFRERVQHCLTVRTDSRTMAAIMFIDLDDFKTINDGLGHEAGDEVLRVIAFRVESWVRGGDTAARLSGDEFAVLMEGFRSVKEVLAAAARLSAVLQEPMSFGGRQIQVSASIGIATSTSAVSAEVFLRNADVAMHHAKSGGKGKAQIFDEKMHESAFERLDLKGELVHALSRNELHLYYQPLIELKTGNLVGFEALARWIHPKRGFISPASFIPLAEETGLIVEIGAWALQQATRQLADWKHEWPNANLNVNVNVSPRQLDDDSIVSTVNQALKQSSISPSWLTLELTEGSGLDDPHAQERLVALRTLGCGIAADDFGTGFASYAALQQLPFTNVKIDRSLIEGLSTSNPKAQAQVRSIIQMGHALGLTITAEGIEDSRQRDSLTVLGADKGQGYLFSKPVAPAEATELLRASLASFQSQH